MKAWLAIAGLLLFLSLPAILTMIPTSPKAVPARVPSATVDDPSSSPRRLLTADDKETVFMQMWSLVDEFYMYFDRRDVDWDAVRDKYLPIARSTRDDDEFHRILRTAMAELGDGHMIIQSNGSDWARPRMYVMPDGEQLVIAQVEPGPDADAAGLRAGMSLLKVDGLPVREAWARMTEVIAASTPAAREWNSGVAILRGRDRSKVTVTASFPGQAPVTATLVRTYDVTPFFRRFEHKVLSSGLVYIGLGTFQDEESVKSAMAALQEVARTQPPGLILDLRFNGGGWLASVEELTGYLIPWSPIVGWTLYHDTGSESWVRPRSKTAEYKGPVVLLTNPGCRSTCDLFATIMKQEGRAVLVGQNPEGAGITYRERVLQHGYKLYMSTPTEFVDADHKPIEGNPAQVDYQVAPTAADWAAGRDPALEKAIELLQEMNQ